MLETSKTSKIPGFTSSTLSKWEMTCSPIWSSTLVQFMIKVEHQDRSTLMIPRFLDLLL